MTPLWFLQSVTPLAGSATHTVLAPPPPAHGVPGLSLLFYALLVAIAVAGVLSAVRVMRGPTVPDRVIALDVLGNLCAGVIAMYAIYFGRPVMLSIALVIALIMFLGTVALSVYIERRARP